MSPDEFAEFHELDDQAGDMMEKFINDNILIGRSVLTDALFANAARIMLDIYGESKTREALEFYLKEWTKDDD